MAAGYSLVPTDLTALPGFEADDHLEAWTVFLRTCRAVAVGAPAVRVGASADKAFVALCDKLLRETAPSTTQAARGSILENFSAFRIEPRGEPGFLTGYFEPEIEGSLEPSSEFTAPIYGLPDDLRRASSSTDYDDRARIETKGLGGRATTLVYLRDHVEAFIVHVQGSARVKLRDGSTIRLTYGGRNGLPYTSIGKLILAAGAIRPEDMSLDRLKDFLRGEPNGGRRWMHQNRSFIFFARDRDAGSADGPIGGAGIRLSPLRSIAIDRTIWPYGHFFWFDADLPWRSDHVAPFQRLMVAQDTGSAIIGPARADVFFGRGEDPGRRAGQIRHATQMHVLLPKLAVVP